MNIEQNQQNTFESMSDEPFNTVDPLGQTSGKNRKRKRALKIFGFFLGIAVICSFFYWLHARQFEETDDAQIEGNLSPIGTRIDGTVLKVYVRNNQLVHVGDSLVDLDPRDNQVKLKQAQALLLQAQSLLFAEQPNIPITKVQNSTNILAAKADVVGAEAAVAASERDKEQAQAQVIHDEAANARAQKDLQRYRLLVEKQEISKSDFDLYDATAKQSAASFDAARAALHATERTVDQRKAQRDQIKSKLMQIERNAAPQLLIRKASVAQQQASVQNAQAQMEQAQLGLTYTKIVSPVSGIVMKRVAQIGTRVSAGQQLLTISQIADLWVTANFKEIQLLHMKTGQPVSVHVDALDKDFAGLVEAIGGSTGSVASVLPPENATGNYVKVVQRIPVRIKLGANQQGLGLLRPGMSVEAKVYVK
jgi:membrane fusion protein, multidrug efflux system